MLDLVDARDDRAHAVGQRRRHRCAVAGSEARRARTSPLTLAGAAAVRAGRGGQDHLDARPARRRAPPPTAAVLVLAPTGKAVDVAVREGAGDEGYTDRQSPATRCATTA